MKRRRKRRCGTAFRISKEKVQKAPLIASKAMSSGPKSTQQKSTGGSLRMSSGKPVMSIAEMQKLAIRMYKALGSNRMLEASSLASEVYGESLHHMEHAKSGLR